VRTFPGPGGKWQISTSSGLFPQRSSNGQELLHRSLENKNIVAAYTATGPAPGTDIQIFGLGLFANNFFLHPDGKRIAIFKAPGAQAQSGVSKVTFIFNFFDEIRRKVAP
jgi:hypothetical protein